MTALHIAPAKMQQKRQDGFSLIEGLYSEDGLRVSEELYWEKYYNHPDFNYEWNNGVLEEKPVADYAKSLMYRWFLRILEHFLMVQPIAKLTVLDIGFRLALPDKTSIRKPDLAVILNDNPIPISGSDRTYAGVYDLCVESLSDSTPREIKRDTVQKKGEYEGIEVKEYYILDDKETYMAFYRLNQAGEYELMPPNVEGVIQSEILPGFQFRIADLYRQPSLMEMSEDEVYRGFVLPEYQAEKKRAKQAEKRLTLKEQEATYEKKRAEQAEKKLTLKEQEATYEKKRAEQAEKEMERMRTKLKSLGISFD